MHIYIVGTMFFIKLFTITYFLCQEKKICRMKIPTVKLAHNYASEGIITDDVNN